MKKRKSPLTPGETEQSKTKRQRKSTKNKNASDIAIQDIVSSDAPPASQLPQQERLAVKSVPPGKGVSLVISNGDRNVTSVKTSDEHFILSQYQPRSITKGIGFVPISTVPPIGSTVTKPSVITTTANHPLDVLATVSASLRTSNFVQDMEEVTKPAARNLIHSFTGKNPLLADGNRQFADKARQLSDDSRIMIDGNRQLAEGNQTRSDNCAAAPLNGNQLPAEENQRNKCTEAARLDSDSIPISADSVKAAKVGFSDSRQKAWDGSETFSERMQSLSEYKQSSTERFSNENQRQTSVVSFMSKNAPVEDTLFERLGNDITVSIISKDQNVCELSKKIENRTMDSNSVDSDGSIKKVQKPKKQRQRKDKKTKIEKPKLDSKDRTTTKTKDRTLSGIKQDISLPNVSENKTDIVVSKPLQQLSSNHNIESKVKQTSPMINALSLSYNNGDNSSALKSIDIERVELSEPIKPIVSDCLENLEQSREVVLQESSKPFDATIVSQDIPSLNVSCDKILALNMSNNENLSSKGKEKNKEAITGKKTAKKENKNKPEGSKSKKPAEKKQKTPRNNVQEKETVSTSAKKSKKGKTDKPLTKTKKQPNEYSDKLNSLASQISLDDKETSILHLLVAPSPFFTKSNVCDSEIKSLEQPAVIANECEKSDDVVMEKKTVKQENSIEDSPGEIPKKKKSKGSTSETQNEISASDKIKKKTSKDEKSTKNNKKPRKKSEKSNIKAVESSNVITKPKKEVAPACANAEDSSVAVDEMLSSVDDESKLNRNEQPGKETISVKSEPMTTDAVVNMGEREQDREDIVFVNDQSVGDFVKGGQDSVLYRKRKRCTSPSMNFDSVVSESSGKLLLNIYFLLFQTGVSIVNKISVPLVARLHSHLTCVFVHYLPSDMFLYYLPSDIESSACVTSKDTTAADNKKVKNKKPSSLKPTENGEKKDAKVRKKKIKKDNPLDETKNDSSITMEIDKSALDDSVKLDVRKDSEAKKKAKKPKESKESKLSKIE